jgi:hypothetical protein
MVMFHDDIPYAVARDRGAVQAGLLDELTRGCRSLDEIDLDAALAKVCDLLPPLSAPRQR